MSDELRLVASLAAGAIIGLAVALLDRAGVMMDLPILLYLAWWIATKVIFLGGMVLAGMVLVGNERPPWAKDDDDGPDPNTRG